MSKSKELFDYVKRLFVELDSIPKNGQNDGVKDYKYNFIIYAFFYN